MNEFCCRKTYYQNYYTNIFEDLDRDKIWYIWNW